MQNPENTFKAALKAGRSQVGIWNSISEPSVVEMLAGAGFDWMLIDAEHTPLSDLAVMQTLQCVAAYPTAPVVRVVANDTAAIKRLLDIGAQTLMVPYVETAQQAQAAVDAMRYGPEGVRGFAGLTRASRYGQVAGYGQTASDQLCLLVQVETRTGIQNLDAIAAVDGVDGVFIGPADLAASMGHPGNTGHPEVVAAVEGAVARLKALGMPSGFLSLDEAMNARCIELGTTFTAVGVDIALLISGVKALRARF
ncbi:aldolase/citrate lyase family protein [Oceaniglobus roseus]|uniref:aldolase/citrate lyase family protein n=1 Tax=Oceaniglobus roseus TaxID=1737570 RepID=UPI000C7ED506|nr:aldolase/citrate lyase family protein [Kandeliimicrobium roseum]